MGQSFLENLLPEYQEILQKKLKLYEKKHKHQSFTETEFLLMMVAEIQNFVDKTRSGMPNP